MSKSIIPGCTNTNFTLHSLLEKHSTDDDDGDGDGGDGDDGDDGDDDDLEYWCTTLSFLNKLMKSWKNRAEPGVEEGQADDDDDDDDDDDEDEDGGYDDELITVLIGMMFLIMLLLVFILKNLLHSSLILPRKSCPKKIPPSET